MKKFIAIIMMLAPVVVAAQEIGVRVFDGMTYQDGDKTIRSFQMCADAKGYTLEKLYVEDGNSVRIKTYSFSSGFPIIHDDTQSYSYEAETDAQVKITVGFYAPDNVRYVAVYRADGSSWCYRYDIVLRDDSHAISTTAIVSASAETVTPRHQFGYSLAGTRTNRGLRIINGKKYFSK